MRGKITFQKGISNWGKIMAILMVMLLPGLVKGQTAGSYTFTQTSGTYTPITGGTVINTTIPDSWESSAIALSPGFYFCGTMYNTIYVTSNGAMSLGGTTGPGSTQYNGILNNGSGSGINLCPFNADLVGSSVTGATPEIRYQIVGNEHVFQWQDISRWAAGERFSFQARLNFMTGEVKYVYSVTSVGTATNYQPVIGIRTATTAGNWQNRKVTDVGAELWATSLLGTTTSDNLRFTTATTNPKQPATGLTYSYVPPTAPPGCSGATLPAVSAAVAAPANICVTGSVNLSLGTTVMPPVVGFTYQWEWSTSATGPWTVLATTPSNTYTATGVNSSRYFKCSVICNGNTASPVWSSTVSNQVVVSNPGSPTAINGTRCGPGTVSLGVTPPAGTTVNWYAAATGGAPVGTGNTYTTPFLTANTTFYATAGSGATSSYTGKPTPVSTSGNSGFSDVGLMFDAISSFTLTSVDVYPMSPTNTSGTITIDLKNATGTTLQTTTANVTISAAGALNTVPLNFTIPAGTGYRLVVSAVTNISNLLRESVAANINFPYTLPGVCSITSAYTGGASASFYYYFYNWLVSAGCEGPRVPVQATLTTPPTFTKSAPAVLCSNAIGTIAVTSPVGNYANYAWSPVADLYTNATATTAYTGGNASTLYFKSPVAGMHTYAVYATNTTGAQCAYADTVRIWVQPDSIVIKAAPDTICNSGTSTLRLVPGADYFAGSIQWQESANGSAYNDIPGATGVSYTTPVLTDNHYYRVQIKAGTGVTCEMPVKYIVVAHPALHSWADSFNCGPGTVTLKAEVGGNANVRWYANPGDALPIGAGSPWATPYLGTTDTFYVTASTGTPQPAPTFIGTGTSTTTGAASPYYRGNWANKVQYLITSNEMTAAGFTPGLISSLGFDVTTAGTALQNMNIKMKNTTVTTLTTTFENNMEDVYSIASYTPVANTVNTHVFQTPFYWDGSNIVVEVCYNNGATGTTSAVKYNSGNTHYHYNNAANHCTVQAGTSNFTSTTRPNMRIGMIGACESARQPVIAHIYPKPAVNLGQDINRCVDAGAVVVLDAGVQPNTPHYLWDDNSTSQVRAVTQSGTYRVTVTNSYTCQNSDTIQVTLRNNPVVNLGNDTTVCNGVVLNLNAGNDGVSYFWNTGQTTNTININNAGVYIAFVTNGDGCMKSDTIRVTMDGLLPTIQGISVTNNGAYTFHYTAVNPQNVIGYDWDFGDGSPHSYLSAPTHTYAAAGNYIVVLKLSSTCGFYADSSSANIVGIHQVTVDNNELMVYPNPTSGTATLQSKNLKMEEVTVYNVLGQVVQRSKTDSPNKHTLKLEVLAPGMYTIQVLTDKGNVARKLEIVK
ncbi:T9SS type A sorting domain-containing protein [Taibaiella chishuiensis]|uniref:Putative secreted protein (Por secretion system target) n=1 Tax=Taibaiella chishuiensis TaxID=1434707 RepID=A0A2P8DBA1_9BACT|nr:T9SS type A sorting domain-containing protein [Taibaiella chishuiensis]PSK94503.1 putative secreted protein (Por secretion system target) [Taibaiella chishuiensis]